MNHRPWKKDKEMHDNHLELYELEESINIVRANTYKNINTYIKKKGNFERTYKA